MLNPQLYNPREKQIVKTEQFCAYLLLYLLPYFSRDHRTIVEIVGCGQKQHYTMNTPYSHLSTKPKNCISANRCAMKLNLVHFFFRMHQNILKRKNFIKARSTKPFFTDTSFFLYLLNQESYLLQIQISGQCGQSMYIYAKILKVK